MGIAGSVPMGISAACIVVLISCVVVFTFFCVVVVVLIWAVGALVVVLEIGRAHV